MNKFFVLLLFFPGFLLSQNLDSLYNQFIKYRSSQETTDVIDHEHESEPIKCGFGTVNEVKRNLNSFNPKQKVVLQSMLSRPAADTSIVSPSGRFRIHFKKSGNDAPGYDVMEVARAADSSYNFEVNKLGYPAPPSDLGMGGDYRIDIYIGNLSGGMYGYTEWETQLTQNPDTYTSFIVIDNDFSTHNTKGINGARVTVAHELHHVIQLGSYIYRSNDQFYHEITSTAMEEFVYDSINDYYFYIRSYTDRTNKSLAINNGYNLALWNIFMKDRFGFGILKRTWELMRQNRALNAISEAIAEAGSTFKNEFSLFGQWLYFTGSRAINNKYFEEASNYPQPKPLMTTPFSKPLTTLNIASEPVSLNYLIFTDNNANRDSFVAVISNCDITNGINNISNSLSFKYNLSSQMENGFRKITDGYYSKLESDNSFLLAEMNILNNNPVENILSTEIDYAFPQPFKYSKDKFIYFPVGKTFAGYANLSIYSVDMDLIFSGEVRIITTDKKVVQWNALNNSGVKVPTGIYFYFVKTSDAIQKGKFVLYND